LVRAAISVLRKIETTMKRLAAELTSRRPALARSFRRRTRLSARRRHSEGSTGSHRSSWRRRPDDEDRAFLEAMVPTLTPPCRTRRQDQTF
jgi:hypothetical protein